MWLQFINIYKVTFQTLWKFNGAPRGLWPPGLRTTSLKLTGRKLNLYFVNIQWHIHLVWLALVITMGCFQNGIKGKHQESLCSRQTWPVGLPLIFSYAVQGLGPASRDHIWSLPQVQFFVHHLTCFGKPQEGAGQECFPRVPMCYICIIDERIWKCRKPYGKFTAGCAKIWFFYRLPREQNTFVAYIDNASK